MTSFPRDSRPAVVLAMIGGGLVTAQFVAGKAARDAIYLGSLDVASLPQIVIATSVASILLAFISSRLLKHLPSSVFVPGAFVLSALLFVVEWVLLPAAPAASARLLYLHVSGLGPMLGSGFWLVATDRFDPYTARERFGQIAGAGTLGGLIGALLAERVGAMAGASTMLPLLSVANLACVWPLWRLARASDRDDWKHHRSETPADLAAEGPASGLRVLAARPYLRHLAALVLLGTLGAELVEYLFRAEAVAYFGRGDALLRFFAVFYAVTGVLTFLVQVTSNRLALEKLGLSSAVATPSLALFAGGCGGMLVPGLPALTLARAGESVFRGSLFRSGYEVFYTPVPFKEKRAAKSIIDVGFDRLGDALGGALIRAVLILPAASQATTLLIITMVCAAAAVVVASQLARGYVRALEESLLNRAVELELSDVGDTMTRTVMLRTIPPRTFATQESVILTKPPSPLPEPAEKQEMLPAGSDPELQDIMELRSRDRDRVRRVLRRPEGIKSTLVSNVIPLLAWEPVANDAVFALRKVAEERVGELIDALLDPNQPFAVRRRLARVFSTCVSQRAADGLIIGLDDLRFEVRFQCGRSLAGILDKNPRVRIDSTRIFEVVEREVTVGRPVWESRQLLDRLDDPEQRSFVDEFVQDRANQSLAHVFTLLSLVLPTDPLRTAFRALHTDDQRLRGTALEYLEGVLPTGIRQRLWPFLDDRRAALVAGRSREEIMDDLLKSNQSIMLNLEEIKRRSRPDGA